MLWFHPFLFCDQLYEYLSICQDHEEVWEGKGRGLVTFTRCFVLCQLDTIKWIIICWYNCITLDHLQVGSSFIHENCSQILPGKLWWGMLLIWTKIQVTNFLVFSLNRKTTLRRPFHLRHCFSSIQRESGYWFMEPLHYRLRFFMGIYSLLGII